MDFIQAKEVHIEPVASIREPSRSPSANQRKRSISPEIKRDHVHNNEDHQNKRQKLFIKRALLKSFMSSVNTKIDYKNPSLPITIPTHLFFDQSSSLEGTIFDINENLLIDFSFASIQMNDHNEHQNDMSMVQLNKTFQLIPPIQVRQH